MPEKDNPLFAEGNMDCSAGQKGTVWFLAGNFGGQSDRTCTIKKGKPLFLPLLNSVKWTPIDLNDPEDCGNKAGMTKQEIIEDCRAIAALGNDDITKWTCTVDGMPCIWFTQVVRAQSDPLPFNIKAGSILTEHDFGYESGVRKISISDGYWVMLKPLTPGQHALHFSSAYEAGNEKFSLDVTYHLTVSELDY